jgi:hypothetical protein
MLPNIALMSGSATMISEATMQNVGLVPAAGVFIMACLSMLLDDDP